MTAEKMLARAREDLGLSGRPNVVTRWYAERNGSQFLGGPWCNMAITCWARHSDNATAVLPKGDRAFTVWHARDGEGLGRWHAGTAAEIKQHARPGALVFFDWDGTDSIDRIDHIGIVEKNLQDGRVQTIEGNAQPYSAPVLTPTGWTTIGQLRIGDLVIDPMGQSSKVTGIHPKGMRDIYRVTTASGQSALACDEHLWEVTTRDGGAPVVLTTMDVKAKVDAGRRVRLPALAPVEFDAPGAPPAAPYLLGALLGDGSLRADQVKITTVEQQIVDHLAGLLPEGCEFGNTTRKSYRGAVTATYLVRGPSRWKANPLLAALRDMGVLGLRSWEKHIPETYLTASVPVRLELLRGLMDTDGSIDSIGRAEFCTVSERLARDVQELIRSLGGNCNVHAKRGITWTSPAQAEKQPGRNAWILRNIYLPENPFRLARKAERWVMAKKRSGAYHRRIVSVESAGREGVMCISVSASSHLYVTQDYIPTHNTGDVCKRRVRGASVIAGFWNPDYEQTESWMEAIVNELPLLKQGDQGPHVRTMHHLMLARDVQGLDGVGDTLFAPAHSAGIRTLQTAAGLEADGVVGPQTWPVLLAVR